MCYNDSDFNQFPEKGCGYFIFYLTKREDFINCESSIFKEKRFE